jgi:hypothetical protein
MNDPKPLFLTKRSDIAKATGLSMWCISAIRKAGRMTGDSPFTGRITSLRAISAWLKRHPEFVPSKIYPSGKKAPKQRPQGHHDQGAGKSHVPLHLRGRRSASLAKSAPQLEQAV